MTLHKPPPVDAIFSSLLARRQTRGLLRQLTVPDTSLVDFSSNDYLSLSRHPEITRAYLEHLQAGNVAGKDVFSLGSGGSRLLDGNSKLAEALEHNMAEFHGSPAALLFNSGYEANTGLLSSAPQAGDVVIFDEAIHASVHSGIKLSRAGLTLAFRHNCIWDRRTSGGSADEHASKTSVPLNSLDAVLRGLLDGEGGSVIKTGQRQVFIAVESIYSMDGDIAPLKSIVECVEKHLPMGNGLIIVDEAHSNGLLGDSGRGLVCQLGLESRVWARVLTFGKAMGCSGAAVLCSAVTRAYLVNYARTFIYTTAMGLPGLLSIQITHDFVASGQADVLRRKLQMLIEHMSTRLMRICHRHDPTASVIKFQPGDSQSPIIPIFTRQARSLAKHCQSRGFMVRAIVAPTVPHGTDRVRVCVHAGNSEADCDGLCHCIEEWLLEQCKLAEGPNYHETAAQLKEKRDQEPKHKL
ncbi:unnamed protein product [Discula destructiva]